MGFIFHTFPMLEPNFDPSYQVRQSLIVKFSKNKQMMSFRKNMPVLQRSITGPRVHPRLDRAHSRPDKSLLRIKWSKNELCSCKPYPTAHTTTIGPNVPRALIQRKNFFATLTSNHNVCLYSFSMRWEARESFTSSMITLDEVFIFFFYKKSFASCSVLFIIPFSPAVMMIKSL